MRGQCACHFVRPDPPSPRRYAVSEFDAMGTNGSVIVWDLETVPDIAGFAAANDLVSKTDNEVRQLIGDKFPKHIYHSIVCIGALHRFDCRDLFQRRVIHYGTHKAQSGC